MAQIGEPQRFYIAEPVFEPIPGVERPKTEQPATPVTEPEEVPVDGCAA